MSSSASFTHSFCFTLTFVLALVGGVSLTAYAQLQATRRPSPPYNQSAAMK